MPKQPPPVTELPIEPVESWTAPNEVWQPDGGWTNDVIQEINAENKNSGADKRNWKVLPNVNLLFFFSFQFYSLPFTFSIILNTLLISI